MVGLSKGLGVPNGYMYRKGLILREQVASCLSCACILGVLSMLDEPLDVLVEPGKSPKNKNLSPRHPLPSPSILRSMPSASPSLALSSGPVATTIRVKELIERVRQGSVRIPDFQRPLRWKSKDVNALLDSVWRGYPIGSLLFWKRPAEAASVRIGSLIIDAPDFAQAWWLVDGQQRTTALAACLLEMDQDVDSRWTVSFDPRTQTFREGAPGPSEQASVVPVAVLGDLRRLGRWIRESGADDELIDIIEDAQRRILDYSVPAYLVESQDERVLREIFARLNSSGSRMRADEIFQALHGGAKGSSTGQYDLEKIAAGCDVDSFGQPSRADVLKIILAIAGKDPSAKLASSIDALGGLPPAVEIESAIAKTRSFLQRDCQIPWIGLLPYPVAFVLLARWFYCFPETDQLARMSLRQWLWRYALWGANQKNKLPHTRDQIKDIQEGDLENSLRRLMARVESVDGVAWHLEKFNQRIARSRIELMALLSKQPSDELGPLKVQSLVAEATGRVGREVFTRADTKPLGPEVNDLAKTAANRVILGSVHSGLKTTLRAMESQPELLASHLVDQTAFQALMEDDIQGFLQRRSFLVIEAVHLFLSEHANFNEPFVRPVQYYLDPQDEA